MKKALITLLLIAPAVANADDSRLETLFDWMTGSFSSAAQAADDPDYYHISLEMASMWQDREGEYWIYVEQAVAATKDQPYRQRVYRLSKGPDGVFESAVYLLPEPEQAIGAWNSDAPLAGIAPADLQLRDGCTVFLKRVDENRFAGGTRGTECASNLRGAAYATSDVIVTPEGIESWDRGFDAEGTQVWGAEKGPYIFLRD